MQVSGIMHEILQLKTIATQARSVEISKDALGSLEEEVWEDLNALTVQLLSAIYEVIWAHVGELACKALAVVVFFLIAWKMSVEPVGHMNLAEAVVFAVCDSCDILLCTLEEAEIVLLVNDLADRLVQVAQSFSFEWMTS